MGRSPCCDKANVKRGPWSPEEDDKLKSHIEQHGTGGNWISLPQKIGLKRCGKSCRLRWLNYLRPNIKHGGFSEEEDNIICSLYINIGSRWSVIASQLPGRTDNDIKNYWNTRLKKKLLNKQRKDQPQNQQPSGVQEPENKKKEINGSAMDAIKNNGAGLDPYCLQTPATVFDDDQASVMRLFVKLEERLAGHEAAAAVSNGTSTPFMASESASPQTLFDDSTSLLSNKHSTELDEMFSFSSDNLEELDCFHDIVIGAIVDEGCGSAVASESMNWNEQMIPLVNSGMTSMLQSYQGVQYNSLQLQPHVRSS